MKPVSKTAYYCAGVRMLDAQSEKPLVNDTYAKALMGEEGIHYWESFKKFKNPNGSNIARCYLIDSWIKSDLIKNPETTVILIGAGLDSRAFRLTGGNWIELDEPGIIEYKNNLLPASQSKNKLQRISIDFEKEKLADKLSIFSSTHKAIIVIEGVFMYLTSEQKKELLTTITSLFKNHILFCDLMNEQFFNKLGKNGIHIELSKSGASFKDILKDPVQSILEFGYQLKEVQSNLITASKFGLLTVPKFIISFLMRRLAMGYSSYQFEFSRN